MRTWISLLCIPIIFSDGLVSPPFARGWRPHAPPSSPLTSCSCKASSARSCITGAAKKDASAEWSDDDMAGLSGGWQDQQLTPSFLDDLDDKLSVMVSAFAINTCSYYFVEFRDEVNEKWMMGFLDYRKNGFPGGKWTSYIEAMIALDKLQVEVLMKCSKAVLRARRIPAGANVAMQYHHDVEPRRIAHKILTVREDVSNEIIEDLGCVLTENAEIVRFATTWATDGREAAEKSRKLTRIRSQGGNTPMRDKHYTQLNVFVTQLAMELIRNDLMSSRDETALETLRVLEAKMETDDVARSILERMLAETEGPRQFLEELYYKGIADGASLKGGKAMNVLKVAENLMAKRAAIAKETTKLLTQQNLYNRQYYKLIKDRGGFPKFDFQKATLKLVDLDAVDSDGRLKEVGPDYEATRGGFRTVQGDATAATAAVAGAGAGATAASPAVEPVTAAADAPAKVSGDGPGGEDVDAENPTDDDASVFDFDTFGSGPMLM